VISFIDLGSAQMHNTPPDWVLGGEKNFCGNQINPYPVIDEISS
jgi:hypothetical protein